MCFFIVGTFFHLLPFFPIFITTILVPLAIAFQKDHWNSFYTNFTHRESLFFISNSHYINLTISKEQSLCWKKYSLSNHVSLTSKPQLAFSTCLTTHLYTVNASTKRHYAQFTIKSLCFPTSQLVPFFPLVISRQLLHPGCQNFNSLWRPRSNTTFPIIHSFTPPSKLKLSLSSYCILFSHF